MKVQLYNKILIMLNKISVLLRILFNSNEKVSIKCKAIPLLIMITRKELINFQSNRILSFLTIIFEQTFEKAFHFTFLHNFFIFFNM
jgi:hypothetical protein